MYCRGAKHYVCKVFSESRDAQFGRLYGNISVQHILNFINKGSIFEQTKLLHDQMPYVNAKGETMIYEKPKLKEYALTTNRLIHKVTDYVDIIISRIGLWTE